MKILLPSLALFCCGLLCVPVGAQTRKKTSSHRQPETASATTAAIMAGEKLFQINCGRCHNPPQDLSPREARAVVRQMRVRAMLSEKQEKQLLEFLAP